MEEIDVERATHCDRRLIRIGWSVTSFRATSRGDMAGDEVADAFASRVRKSLYLTMTAFLVRLGSSAAIAAQLLPYCE